MVQRRLVFTECCLKIPTDMLDEFTGTKICKTPRPSRKPSIPPLSNQYEDTAAEATTEDFSKLLQDQMAALMGSIDESPDMKNKVEHMIKDLGAAADAERSSESISHAKDAVQMGAESLSKEEPFQETIRKTMERMQVSGEQAGAARQTEHSDEMLAKMLKDMQSSGLSDETGDEGFNKMLLGMMEQLTNKEILYEPMKELHNKFPGWLQKNRASINSADLKRYEEQQTLVAEIVARFEGKEYSDSNPEDREFIVDRMQQVCYDRFLYSPIS